MKALLASILAAGVLAAATAANAQPNPFTDPNLALPFSQGYEQALPRVSNDDYRDALPFTQETFPDITVATP